MQKPSVKDYLNCAQFLQDHYSFEKTQNPKFSYQIWADQLGVKSKSYLRFAVLGKRNLSPVLVAAFSQWFGFSELDKKYFITLVEFCQSEDANLKKVYSKELMTLIRLDPEGFQVKATTPVLGDPIYFHVRDLLSCGDIQHTPQSIADIFKISLESAQKIVGDLQSFNLVETTPQGTLQAKQDSIRITDNFNHENLAYFHKASLQNAINSIGNPVTQRKFRSLNLILNDGEFSEIHDKISEFLTHVFHEYSTISEAKGRRIYQLNYNMSSRTSEI